MMTNPTITIVGNLTRDPELRYTSNGTPVTSFTLAVNHQRRIGEAWEDMPAEFFDVSCWRGLAENVASTLAKGDRTLVYGQLRQRSWENDQGEPRRADEIRADAVGPDLLWATATLAKARRRGPDQPPHPADDPTADPAQPPAQPPAAERPNMRREETF